MNMDSSALERLLTQRTKAILAVHLYGLPVDLEPVRALTASRAIPIIEDAAQAHGASVRGRRVGSLGDVAAFSFYPGKNLGAFGDGGAVTTASADLAQRIRQWGNYGAERKYEHNIIGTNSRLDSLQAAFLTEKLAALDQWNRRRQAIAERYLEGMEGLDGLKLPFVPDGCEPVWHLFVVRHAQRNAFAQRLRAYGIETQIHYPVPNHFSGAYREEFGHISLPVTEKICGTCLSLPMGPHLTDAHVDQVVEAVRSAAL
jgi:dTDP-3-amino-3,4,6-trideoxy-alpha-D-glucose transaminase